jgi:hypothetical protein
MKKYASHLHFFLLSSFHLSFYLHSFFPSIFSPSLLLSSFLLSLYPSLHLYLYLHSFLLFLLSFFLPSTHPCIFPSIFIPSIFTRSISNSFYLHYFLPSFLYSSAHIHGKVTNTCLAVKHQPKRYFTSKNLFRKKYYTFTKSDIINNKYKANLLLPINMSSKPKVVLFKVNETVL